MLRSRVFLLFAIPLRSLAFLLFAILLLLMQATVAVATMVSDGTGQTL
jgi:hypothetical protein